MSNSHDIFQLIWKSSYAVDKNTIDVVIKELNDEIRYQKTIMLPQAKTSTAKEAILNTLQSLRKHRNELVAKYDDRRLPRDSGGLGGDPQDTDQNYKNKAEGDTFKIGDEVKFTTQNGVQEGKVVKILNTDKGEQKLAISNGKATYELWSSESRLTHKSQTFKKSISKRDILKALYGQAWGSTAGLDIDKLEKMNDSELDAHIKALEVLFD